MRVVSASILGSVLGCGCSPAPVELPATQAEPLLIKHNGGWCWFQDPRAVIDHDQLLVGTVAGANSVGSARGDIEITSFDLGSERATSAVLHPELQSDDHASPSIALLGDGRYLSVYAGHGIDAFMRWRISRRPGDASEWHEEQTLETEAPTTYSNTFVLSAESHRVYSFFRSRGDDPHVMFSDDPDAGFTLAGKLLAWDQTADTGADPDKITGRSTSGKPYVRYASDGVATIHLITTEDHPRGYDNGIYHGVIRDGALHDSFGNVVDERIDDGDAPSVLALTRVFEGHADRVAWTTDIELDDSGQPYIAFSVQRDGAATRSTDGADDGYDHRYFYGRFDGSAWHVHEIGHAGTRLYAQEQNYTGLVALHPHDPDTVFISTNADPITGDPIISSADGERHWELYLGKTSDLGEHWSWTAITGDSTSDNLRPVVPAWRDDTLLVWLRGRYESMNTYNLDVVALRDPASPRR